MIFSGENKFISDVTLPKRWFWSLNTDRRPNEVAAFLLLQVIDDVTGKRDVFNLVVMFGHFEKIL